MYKLRIALAFVGIVGLFVLMKPANDNELITGLIMLSMGLVSAVVSPFGG